MSCLQNEGKLNNEKLTVIERERNKKVVLKFRTPFINCVNCSKMLGRFDWRQSANVCNCPLHQQIDDFLVVRIASDKVNKINK